MRIALVCAPSARLAIVALATSAAFHLTVPPSFAQDKPVGEPVRWDQQRVTEYAKELKAAVSEAKEAVRKSPLSHNIAQRRTYYELLEDMRLLENTSNHLASELAAGKDADATRPTFERLESLRHDAEEHARRAMIEAPVIDALTKAGSIHNRMKPYYYGLR